jgi:hypothetical protein
MQYESHIVLLFLAGEQGLVLQIDNITLESYEAYFKAETFL